MKKLVALYALLLLAGCAAKDGDTALSREQVLSYLNTAYLAATVATDICVQTELPPCNRPDVVDGITQARAVLDLAVKRGRATIEASTDASTVQLGLRIVLDAVAVYAAALRAYGVSGG